MIRLNIASPVACAMMVIASMVLPQSAQAGLRLGSLFTDHIVLQCGMPVPVWGTADPGAEVKVAFADQQKSVTVTEDGKWMVTLNSIASSFAPRVLTVTSKLDSKIESRRCSDVVVGEVWICSGQSNM